jgi:hypothetical protein
VNRWRPFLPRPPPTLTGQMTPVPIGATGCYQASKCLLSVAMAKTLVPLGRSRDIFERLVHRGIEYEIIKSIVSFQIPQAAYFFVQQFGRRSLGDVLRQIERWKDFLEIDFLLPARERAEVIRTINQTLLLTNNAMVQANLPRIGDWEIQYGFIPTGQDESGNPIYIRPALGITARHRDKDEIRHASIPYGPPNTCDLGANPFQKAFEELGLWGQVKKGSLRRHLVSSRKPQGWPIYTQSVIPQLYEFLAPYYFIRGHHSEKRDTSLEKRKALFPKELLKDMLDILRMEHPHVFELTTVNQLKSSVQRHLAKKANGIKSPL